jgi:hypothetical protein
MLKKIFLIIFGFFTFQSYCSEGQSPKERQHESRMFDTVSGHDEIKYGFLMFDRNGQIVAIATREQAEAAADLSQRLWDMSCENLTCTNCPRCVGKIKARSTNEGEKGQLNERLLTFISQAISYKSSGK